MRTLELTEQDTKKAIILHYLHNNCIFAGSKDVGNKLIKETYYSNDGTKKIDIYSSYSAGYKNILSALFYDKDEKTGQFNSTLDELFI